MTDVTLKVNERALVRHLKLGFTSQTTVLGELMQNARRAKATVVVFDYDEALGRLTVMDDGFGIDDLQLLLTVAESGWDAETVAQEHPFGLGFLSAVYAAERLTVESRGRRLCFASADLLAFRSLEVLAADTTCGTRLVLDGLQIPFLEAALRHRARGFPIEVRFNGESLPGPDALDGGRPFEPTAVGRIHLYGLHPDEDWQAMRAMNSSAICRDCRSSRRPATTPPRRPWSISTARGSVPGCRIATSSSTRRRCFGPSGRKCRPWRRDASGSSRGNSSPRPSPGAIRASSTGACSSSSTRCPSYPARSWHASLATPRSRAGRVTGSRHEIKRGEVRLAQLEARLQEEPGSLVRWLFAWRAGYTLIEAERLDPGHWVQFSFHAQQLRVKDR